MRFAVWVCMLGAMFGQSVAAQDAIPSAKLREDVEVLRRVYEQAHPGLYRYNTREQMDGHFAALRAEFARDRTLPEAYVAISQFLAKIKCGHSYANFFNQKEEVARALFGGKNRVPFLFRWIDGRMIVTGDLTPDHELRPGTEILAIDGHSAPEILARLLTIARADGGNDAKRVSYLEVRGKDRYEAFDVFLPLFYPDLGERLTLSVRQPGAKEPVTLSVAAHDPAQREALGKAAQAPRGDGEALWRFETGADGVAYLRMPGCALYNTKWDWRGFLDRGIDELIDRRAPGLIVDLRDCEGGLDDIGIALIERITPREFRTGSMRRFVRYRTLPDGLAPYLDTWDWRFKDWGDSAVPVRDGFFRLTRDDDDAQGDRIAPRGRRFEGKLVVLVNAANSSATFQFAKLVKENHLGTLVGQTTGGNHRGINGGAFFFATLPNSRIEFDLPLIALFPDGDTLPDGKALPFPNVPDAGVEPDVKVTPSAADIAAGVDAERAAAMALFRAGRLPELRQVGPRFGPIRSWSSNPAEWPQLSSIALPSASFRHPGSIIIVSRPPTPSPPHKTREGRASGQPGVERIPPRLGRFCVFDVSRFVVKDENYYRTLVQNLHFVAVWVHFAIRASLTLLGQSPGRQGRLHALMSQISGAWLK